MGFEPTHPFGQTVFKTASLWPLRYLSNKWRFSILQHLSEFVKRFFHFFNLCFFVIFLKRRRVISYHYFKYLSSTKLTFFSLIIHQIFCRIYKCRFFICIFCLIYLSSARNPERSAPLSAPSLSLGTHHGLELHTAVLALSTFPGSRIVFSH